MGESEMSAMSTGDEGARSGIESSPASTDAQQGTCSALSVLLLCLCCAGLLGLVTLLVKGLAGVRELICTVSEGATMVQQYPPDGLCHYLYYAHVFVHRKAVRATRVASSYMVFVARVKNYKRTQGGLAFDIRYNAADTIGNQDIRSHLNSLFQGNIRHYGVLMVAYAPRMAGYMTKAKALLEAFKTVQGNDQSRKTVMGIGLYSYSGQGDWDRYKNWVQEAAESFRADTVIAISSTFEFADKTMCRAAPPDAMNSSNDDFPSLGCENMATPMDYLSTITSSRNYPDNRLLFMWDNTEKMLEKAQYILKLPVRYNFSWLYLDVHWADFSGLCNQTGGPFEKVNELKHVFGIGPTPTQSLHKNTSVFLD